MLSMAEKQVGVVKETTRNDDEFLNGSAVSFTHESEIETGDELYIDPKEEAALVRKLDFRLLPMLAFMYFLSSLDRSNIGNAYTSGMKEDLKLTSRQYSNAVSVFYSTYLAAELPAVLVLKRVNVRYYMSFLVFSWSIITLCNGFVQNHKSLIALRVLLGCFEGGFFPAMTLIISMVYKQQEQAKRIAFFWFCLTIGSFRWAHCWWPIFRQDHWWFGRLEIFIHH